MSATTCGRNCCRVAAPCCSPITALTGGLEAARLAVLDLRSGTRTILMRGAGGARYAPSGHLVYAEAGTLLAVPFDVQRLETRGTAVPESLLTSC